MSPNSLRGSSPVLVGLDAHRLTPQAANHLAGLAVRLHEESPNKLGELPSPFYLHEILPPSWGLLIPTTQAESFGTNRVLTFSQSVLLDIPGLYTFSTNCFYPRPHKLDKAWFFVFAAYTVSFVLISSHYPVHCGHYLEIPPAFPAFSFPWGGDEVLHVSPRSLFFGQTCCIIVGFC